MPMSKLTLASIALTRGDFMIANGCEWVITSACKQRYGIKSLTEAQATSTIIFSELFIKRINGIDLQASCFVWETIHPHLH